VTFGLVVQCLNQLRHCVAPLLYGTPKKLQIIEARILAIRVPAYLWFSSVAPVGNIILTYATLLICVFIIPYSIIIKQFSAILLDKISR